MNVNAEYLVVNGLTRWYTSGSGMVVGCEDLHLRASPSEMIVVLGPSGSGKTTLLTLIAGLISPTKGSLTIGGINPDSLSLRKRQRFRAEHIGMMFQSFSLWSVLTATQNISFAARCAGIGRAEADRRARALLSTMGLDQLAERFPHQLSHGERQRVAAMRAMINTPELLIADEPTASLDSASAITVIERMRDYARTRPAVVLVATHDPRLSGEADRLIRLRDGRMA
jgi:putative ABC transport system ATP-binding protein